MLQIGQYVKVKTEFLKGADGEDRRGEIIYRVEEVDLPFGKEEGNKDGIRFIMIAGTGPGFFPGKKVLDNRVVVENDIKKGRTQILNDAQAEQLTKQLAAKGQEVGDMKHKGTGCIELDM